MDYNTITYAVTGRKAYITLNRPEKRNAFSPELVSELKEAFGAADMDPDVKVVILKANGKAFSAGADLGYLQQLQDNSYEENLEDSESLMALYRLIYTLSKPVIAQIEGHAIAGGCGLATVCDFSIAVPEAMMGYTEVKIGFVPAIVMVFLLRKIGERNARDLMLTGRLVTAVDAMHMGLINEVVEKETIEEKVNALADGIILDASSHSLHITKQMLANVQDMELNEALHYAAEMNAQTRATDDCRHGISSFLNKQKPEWT
ncbi:MAG TPA: methylglutaconyl-CoA hydratase [Bacteroidetes bacterium]|jgi:methylglutaconyl-CoA hydratase|nr:MAG: methylglutaconyl-CoA hydratase [Sphingobacteriales bacterium BACL12 MAG-120802-bin5]KRP13356.1 MAG: methylglutaconyl-CoA hydratase [Sphingobacteriales bacterium BACL12 MAG-120813-bin55]HCK21088.1 methylglutaconyl-CoA hydratase [Bacteroidota bacterium]